MRALFDNLSLKAMSLALAVLLWVVIAGEKTSEMGLSVPLEMRNVPKDLELMGDAVNTVEVRLRASPGVIQRLNTSEVQAQVDLADRGEGEHIIHLTPESIRVPFGVTVVKVTPAMITLHFERTLAKSVPVRPRLIGRPARDYEVAEVTAEPVEVRLAGPKSRVQEVESAFTEPVSVDGAKATVTETVNIGLEDPLLRIQGTPRVRVTARVREVHEERTFEGMAVSLHGGAGGPPRPARVTVTLGGPATVLRAVPAGDVRAYVDVAGATGHATLPVRVEIAAGHPGITVKACEPPNVVVRVLQKRPG